jgi:hypothetical protein
MKVSTPPEGSTLTARQIKILKISIVIMTALLIFGVMALIYGMARQASKLGSAQTINRQTSEPYLVTLPIDRGEVKSLSVSDNIIVLDWKSEGGETLITLDARNGRELGRFKLTPP